MNRPQYFNSTPSGFRDVPYVKPVTAGQNVSGLIPANGYLLNYVIQLDNDAPQLFRSLFIEGIEQAQAAGIQMQLRDAFGVFLTDGYVPLHLFALGAGSTPPDGGSGRAKVFEPELFCPAGSVLIADFYNPSTSAVPLFGSAILQSTFAPLDPVTGTFRQAPASVRGPEDIADPVPNGASQAAAIIAYGGALYQVLQFNDPQFTDGFPVGVGQVNVYKSVDRGATWNILDGAHSPRLLFNFPQGTAGIYFDGGNTLTVASNLGNLFSVIAAPIVLQDFDLSTGLWGAVYGTAGAPSVYGINQIYMRSDGSLLVIGISGSTAPVQTAYVYSGGVWTTNFSLDSLLPGGWTNSTMSSTVYDPLTDTIHMFGLANSGLVQHSYYQQILLTNSIAGFQDLTALDVSGYNGGNPVIVNGNLLLGVAQTTSIYYTVLLGVGLAAPVFSVGPMPGVFPGQPNVWYGSAQPPVLFFDGTTIWSAFINRGANTIYISYTQNLANPFLGWSGSAIFDPNGSFLDTGTYLDDFPTLSIIDGAPYMTIERNFPLPDNVTNNYFLPLAGPGGSQYPGFMEFRGVKRFKGDCAA